MQTPLWQFWADWTIKALGTLATFAAVFVALFNSWLRNWIAPPRLAIALVDSDGYRARLRVYEGVSIRETDGLWYHVRVENRTRWNPANNVYVFMQSIETLNAANEFKPAWAGNAALGWRNDANPQPKSIGHHFDCDLCHVLKNPLQVKLSPIVPGEIPDVYTGPFRIAVTLRARGVEADSNVLRVDIAWDGKWSDDKGQMKLHLVVKAV